MAWVGNGLLSKWKIAATPRCPHCTSDWGAYDDGAHSAAGCQHPALRGVATDRHDAAVQQIADAVRKTERAGAWCLLVSAGRKHADGNAPLDVTILLWALPAVSRPRYLPAPARAPPAPARRRTHPA